MTDETPTQEAGTDEPQERCCPRDGAALTASTYEADVEVDECGKCGGRWLDHGELERIQEIVEKDYRREMGKHPEWSNLAYDVAREMSEAPLACPDCGKDMERQEYARASQVVIDVCTDCRGVWLDKGELERLEIFFEQAQQDAAIAIPWYVRLSLLFKGNKK